MDKRPEIELCLNDFMKCFPPEKKESYELILRRCNFTDPSDPMFAILLFLTFFQDQLVDSIENLSEDFNVVMEKAAKTPPQVVEKYYTPETQTTKRSFLWKWTVTLLLALQMFFSIVIAVELSSDKKSSAMPVQANSHEIKQIDRYWDLKLQHAEQGNFSNAKKESNSRIFYGLMIVSGTLLIITGIQIVSAILAYRKQKLIDQSLKDIHYMMRNLSRFSRKERTVQEQETVRKPVPKNRNRKKEAKQQNATAETISPLPEINSNTPPPVPPPVADAAAWMEDDINTESK